MDISTLTVLLVESLIVSMFLSQTTAVQSNACWDGSIAVDYTGTETTTSNGRTCQPWVDDSPQVHTFHGNTVFPYDGDDVAASNYCRDPDGSSGIYGPWCYTMDPLVRFEYCDIPQCYNLPCTGGEIIGQSDPSTFSTFLDTFTGINYLQKDDSPYGFTCCGTIKQWRVYIQNSGTIRFQVWRKESGSGNYVLRGENVYTYAAGDNNTRHDETVPQNNRITVQEGDLIGWYTAGSDMVSFNVGTTNQTALLGTGVPSVGSSVDFSGAAIGNSRDYAIGAELTASLAPYFENTVASISVSASEAVGTTVHTLTVSDYDEDDVSSLAISLVTNTYFNISGTDIVVKSNLAIGTETLQLAVTDQCSQTGTTTLTVTITAASVSMTSLPATTNVSESITVETLLHTLVVTPAGTYTCTLDAYDPTRAEGSPFIIKNNGTDFGVYLKNAADIRYNVSTSYNVTVTCTNTDPSSDTSYLIINVDPNSQPVFTSFQSSLTIDAATTNINEIVYNATVTDTDGGPITISLTTDPSPAPFSINNDGELRITSDPTLQTQTTYTFILTADDGFSTVTSSNISVTITNINDKPVITNLPTATQTVLENQVAGTYVYDVTQSDANGDTPTFSATYSSPACAGMYTIDSSSGSITTLAPLDYETDTSCNLTITVSDGITTSDPETLTIDVGDEDEPPVLSSSAYVIATEEVLAGTALPSAGISAIDPDGTAVSYSLNCAYVDIDPTSGIVTMTTAYDIETSAASPYTISCTVTATDATSQTATATLDVIVSDANDNAPVFAPNAYTFYIAQGHTGYGVIDTVTATDGDMTSTYNAVTYTISPTTDFSIGGASGGIQNIVDLSGVAAGTSYTLTVTATDGGAPPLTDTATVVISVLTTTTTTTTRTTTATSGDDGFFSDIGNIILLALAAFTALLLAALFAFLIWLFCCKASFLASRNHASKTGPGEKNVRDHPKFPQKANATIANGTEPRLVTEAETHRPAQQQRVTPRAGISPRTSPVGSDRPESGGSYISVASIPNRVSAVHSVRRTNWLSHGMDSPRSVSNVALHLPKPQTSKL